VEEIEVVIELGADDVLSGCDHDCYECQQERKLISKDYKKYYEVYQEAKALINSGYDGPFMGDRIMGLMLAVRVAELDEL
jgi:hypothetical protein